MRRSEATVPAAAPTSHADEPLIVSALEAQLLQLLAQGCSNTRIAMRVGRAEKTVRNRLSLLYQKLGVPNRAAAVAMWVRHGERPNASQRGETLT